MAAWIMYHPKRKNKVFGSTRVYFDKPSHNQDPYIWNDSFLHTYCHMTQIRKPDVNDTMFWVSGDCFPNFSSLFCDLVFVVQKKEYWPSANIMPEKIIDSPEARNDHYAWWGDHVFKRRRRFTLKADPILSFQPQDRQGELIDLVPILNKLGISLQVLRSGLRAIRGSRPYLLPLHLIQELCTVVSSSAAVRLHGDQLQVIRAQYPELASHQKVWTP